MIIFNNELLNYKVILEDTLTVMRVTIITATTTTTTTKQQNSTGLYTQSKYSKTCLQQNAIVPVFFFPFSQVSVLQRVVF